MTGNKRLIAVSGATGGSVVRFLIEDGNFAVRGLTRHKDSAAAKKLAAKGVEVVEAELDDVESLKKAFKGAWGVYGVTNYWEHGDDGETRHGKNMVDAAKFAGVSYFVYATMEWSIGELEVLHFNSKARVNDYLIESGIPRTSIYTAAYYENFENQLRPERASDGSYTLNFNFIPPDAQYFAFAGGDIGAFALAAFSDPEKWAGKDMKVCAEWATVRKWAKEASEETGLDVRAFESTMEDLETSAERGPWAKDLYLMNLYYIRNPESSGVRDEKQTHTIYPQVTTWREYVRANKDKIFR